MGAGALRLEVEVGDEPVLAVGEKEEAAFLHLHRRLVRPDHRAGEHVDLGRRRLGGRLDALYLLVDRPVLARLEVDSDLLPAHEALQRRVRLPRGAQAEEDRAGDPRGE